MSDNKFPDGKLNEQDEGVLMMAISIENKKVRIDFGESTKWLAMTPDMAVDFASMLLHNARVAGSTKPLVLNIPTGVS